VGGGGIRVAGGPARPEGLNRGYYVRRRGGLTLDGLAGEGDHGC